MPVTLSSPTTPGRGKFTNMAPKPMGRSRAGSKSFLIASQINRPPMSHMTAIFGLSMMYFAPSMRKLNSFNCFFRSFAIFSPPVLCNVKETGTYIFRMAPGQRSAHGSQRSYLKPFPCKSTFYYIRKLCPFQANSGNPPPKEEKFEYSCCVILKCFLKHNFKPAAGSAFTLPYSIIFLFTFTGICFHKYIVNCQTKSNRK